MKKLKITLATILLCLGLGSRAYAELPRDKRLHFKAGLVISVISYRMGPMLEDMIKGKDKEKIEQGEFNYHTKNEMGAYRKKGFLYGIGAATLAGAGKEIIYDWALGKGTPEFADFGYTVIGGFAGSLFSFALDSILDSIYEKYHPATTYSSANSNSLNHHTLDQKLNHKKYEIDFMINLKDKEFGIFLSGRF